MSMQVILPYPPADLNPNRSKGRHWGATHKSRNQYKKAVYWEAYMQKLGKIPADRVNVSVTFYPPDRRRRDKDNAIAAFKNGQDTLADMIGIDDSKWNVSYLMEDQPRNCVTVLFEWLEEIELRGEIS